MGGHSARDFNRANHLTSEGLKDGDPPLANPDQPTAIRAELEVSNTASEAKRHHLDGNRSHHRGNPKRRTIHIDQTRSVLTELQWRPQLGDPQQLPCPDVP
jgi:hypothetical protein